MSITNYIPRHAAPLVREKLNRTNLVIIKGPHRSGKTRLARKIAKELDMRFFDLAKKSLRREVQGNPQSFIKNLRHSGAVIDSLERVPELVKILKKDLSKTKNPGKFLITVTAGTLPTHDLVGDVLPIELYPPNQGELSGLSRPSDFLECLFAALFHHGARCYGSTEVWLRALKGGYLGSVLASNIKRRKRFFQDYIDVLDLKNHLIKEGLDPDKLIEKIMNFLSSLARSSGGLLNLISRGNSLQEKAENMEIFLKILERLWLVRRIGNYDNSENNPLRKTSKCYMLDPGMISFLNGWEDSEYIALQAIKGMLLESLVFAEITSSISAFPHLQTGLYYYRDASDREVDFVLTRGKYVVAIEVKSSEVPRTQDASGLKHLRDEVGANFVCGVVLYTGNKVRKLGDRLYAVPVSRMWNVAKNFSV